jgi:hypothetical protein
LARRLLSLFGMRSVDTSTSWSARGMGGKIPSGSAHPPGAPLSPPGTHPASPWRNWHYWIEKAREHGDYFYVAGVVLIFLLAAYILMFDQ